LTLKTIHSSFKLNFVMEKKWIITDLLGNIFYLNSLFFYKKLINVSTNVII